MIEISHQQARRLLRAHLDSHIPNEQWTMLQAHLETCAECRAYGERLGGIEKSLKRALRTGWESAPEPQQDIPALTLASLRQRAQLRKRLLAAGSAAILIAAFILLGGPAGIQKRIAASSNQAGSIPVTQVTQNANPAITGGPGSATAAPTVAAGQFPDVVAYESRRDGKPNGDSEIYLLNPGSQPVDLTNSPAQDTNPAWSPDGEWLAFLSNRDKKVELFVTNVTGSRVVQLTDAPGITWQGPLSWSPDGKWIALTGNRDQQGDQTWVYLVALDGSGANALTGSRGGFSPKFAPFGDELAFSTSDGVRDGITVTYLQTGQQITTHWNANPLVPPPATGSSFEWSSDGAGLVFVAADLSPLADAETGVSGPSADVPSSNAGQLLSDPGSQVIAVRDLNNSLTALSSAFSRLQVASSHWPGAYRAVSWTPGEGIAYLEDLEDARAHDKPSAQPEGCWTVQVTQPGFRRQNSSPPSPLSFGGVCVVGGLQRASWTPDGRWLVVRGRLPSEKQLSIFALRMPGRFGFGRGLNATPPATQTPGEIQPGVQGPGQPLIGTFLRLVNDPWAGELPAPRPRLSPNARPISINPQPAKALRNSLGAADQRLSDLSQRMGGPQGQILYTVQNNAMSVVVSANPDGTGGQVLLASLMENHCPVGSPNGSQIALTQLNNPPPVKAPNTPLPSINEQGSALGDGVFIMDSNGTNLREVSRSGTIPGVNPQTTWISYGCPAWSPDGAPGGPYLATLVNAGQEWYLAVLPAGGLGDLPPDQSQPAPRYIALGQGSWSSSPVWSDDGQSIFLLRAETSNSPPGLRVIGVPADPQAPLTVAQYARVWQTQNSPSLAISPDGKTLVEVEISRAAADTTHLNRINLPGGAAPNQVGPPVYLHPPEGTILSESVTWLYGQIFGVVLQGGPTAFDKSMFYLYNMQSNTVQQLALFGDRVNSAAWSPDGRWLVFSSESGLWGLDISGALQGAASPVWLSPQPVEDLDWK